MAEWSVLVEALAPAGREAPELEDDRLGDLLDLLTDVGGAVGGDRRGWSARVTVEADSIESAISMAKEIVAEYTSKLDFPAWPIDRVEAMSAATQEAELAKPNFPDIVGSGEVLEFLGISKQRLWQLRNSGEFPEPMVSLSATPIWLRGAVEAFRDRSWNRQVGRPSKVQELLAANEELADEIEREQAGL